jgi:hypothetical protein
MQSIVEFLRAERQVEIPLALSRTYEKCVALLRERCISHSIHIRPSIKANIPLNRTASPGLLVKDPTDRLVPESLCPSEQMRQARLAEFQPEHNLAGRIQRDLTDAVRYTVENRKNISGWREGQIRVMLEVVKDLAPLAGRGVVAGLRLSF